MLRAMGSVVTSEERNSHGTVGEGGGGGSGGGGGGNGGGGESTSQTRPEVTSKLVSGFAWAVLHEHSLDDELYE